MELPNLGQKCTESTCKQLDFLPLKCRCGKIFCSEHFNKHSISCPEVAKQKEVNLNKIDDVFTCSLKDCASTSLLPILCDRCNQHFCVEHRHAHKCYLVDHAALAAEKERYAEPVRRFNEAKQAVDAHINESLEKAKKKPKSSETASKLQLMRIKSKATGMKTIPSADRIYFLVNYPKEFFNKSSPVFVSKTWTIGRAIDAIAQECKIPNHNNVKSALKLRLFKSDGHILGDDTSDKLETLLTEGTFINGDTLNLEYVSPECKNLVN